MRTIEWRDGAIITIDQTRLPNETVMVRLRNCREVAEAISTMKIRGAPLIGVAAAFALAATANNSEAQEPQAMIKELEEAANTLVKTRPTAVNLSWALNRILKKARSFSGDVKRLALLVLEEAQSMADEDVEANRRIGEYGSELISDGDTVLTHCNAGALATVDYGTALGIVRTAVKQGKRISVMATETRPRLQGAKLTTFELKRDGVPVTLITDNAVGYVMQRRLVDKVVVGADRIVRDAVFNKIGTFTVAVLAKTHGIPFYVAAPKSTFDLTRGSADIVIEERRAEEVTQIGCERIAVEGVDVLNPAFDVTPLEYVTAIVCESGILYKEDLAKLATTH